MYKRGSQFPNYGKQATKDNVHEVLNDLVQHINERYAFQLENEFSAIQKGQGSGTTSIVQNFIGSGTATTQASKTRVKKQTVSSGGNVTVSFDVPLSRSDYAVVTELLDASNNRLLSVAFPNTQGVSGLTVYCQDAGSLTTIAIEP